MIRLSFALIPVALCAGIVSCTGEPTREVVPMAEPNDVPEWAKYVVWYQIFPERFRNGDPSNDPTANDIVGAWPDEEFDGWDNTPWGHDWYRQEPWARQSGLGFYVTNQARRFGGDLAGIIEKLDYLEDLGVSAIYLNPVNESPSLHKYDPSIYRHVDNNFGPDPEGDLAIMASENPIDPSTWRWTSADSLLLALVGELHDRGMRVILDYSWNHTGKMFWAFREAVEDPESPYREWYTIYEDDDPATPENELRYEHWGSATSLPEIRKLGVPPDHQPFPLHAFEGDLPPTFKAHVFEVTRRWLDPNGDGDPSDGVDGYRLDVAGEVPVGFWRDYRTFVKGINPEAFLVGEIWWEQWPDRLADPNPWLGPVFDAVMNYRWYPPIRSFLNGAPMFAGEDPVMSAVQSASGVVSHLDSLAQSVPPENARAMMNTSATHDAPRLSSSLYNRNPYKAGSNPQHDASYKIDRPDQVAFARLRMLVALQFAYVGAPHIWNGDEVGMWGGDDPDNRKPMVWGDIAYEIETTGPDGLERNPDTVSVDRELLEYYARVIEIRNTHMDVLVEGKLGWPYLDDERGILVMSRALGSTVILVALNNNGTESTTIDIPVPAEGVYRSLLDERPETQTVDGVLKVTLEPLTAVMLAN